MKRSSIFTVSIKVASLSALFLGAFIFIPILSFSTTTVGEVSLTASASPAYEYFGYTPASNFSSADADLGAAPLSFRFGWEVNSSTGYYVKNYGWVDNGTCYIYVTGYNDSTTVQVFDVTKPEPFLRETFKVNRMQFYNTTIPSKTYFKVVSDKPVTVLTGGGGAFFSGFNLFYPSTDGGYAGYEFIFTAVYSRGRMERPAPGGVIHALENCKVTVYDDKGGVFFERELKANETRKVAFMGMSVYRVVSTGRVLVATWSQYTIKAVPAVTGGFTGTYFSVYQDGTSQHGVYPLFASMIIVSQGSSGHVKIVDTTNDQTMIEKDLNPNSYWFLTSNVVDFMNKLVAVRSTSGVLVLAGTVYAMNPVIANFEGDVTIVGVRANEPTTLYVVSKAIAFSPKATARVTAGSVVLTIPQGRFADLPTGLVTVTSNSTLLVEVVSEPTITFPDTGEPQTLTPVAQEGWGTHLLSADGAEIRYPPPKAGSGDDITMYGAIGAVIAVVVVVVVWRKPWKKA